MIALFEQYPALATALPRVPLLTGPTPVRRLAKLGADLWVKHDALTASPYGGNKPRKLEFLLGDARRRGATTLVTVGGLGSNHALATCIYGRREGFDVHVLLFPQPVTDHVRMSLKLLARHANRMTLGASYAEQHELVNRIVRSNPGAYRIPAGGSTPVGAMGLVNAAFELAAQVRAGELPEPAQIVVAAGTCGTLAGLVLGLKLAGLASRVVGVQVVDREVTNPRTIAELMTGAAALLAAAGVPAPVPGEGSYDLLTGYFGAGYGAPTEAGERAVARARDAEGLMLESTYTGKAFAAALDRTGSGPVLFWNTFAGPVLAAEAAGIPVSEVPPEFRSFLD